MNNEVVMTWTLQIRIYHYEIVDLGVLETVQSKCHLQAHINDNETNRGIYSNENIIYLGCHCCY